MARKKFEEGFKENAIEYCKTHSDKTIKACAADLGIGYSTLRRWIAQSEEQANGVADEVEEVKEEVQAASEIIDEAEHDSAKLADEKSESEAVNEVPVVESATSNEVLEEEVPVVAAEVDIEDENVVEEIVDDVDDEIANKREGVKSQLGDLIETAGSGMSEAVQLIGLYKKRHELKKVQKKLQKEKEKRMKR